MSDMDYVFAVARIRVKEKYLLSDADVSQMVSMKDDRSVLGFLEDRGWGDSASSGNADAVLQKEEEKAREVLRECAGNSDIFEILSLPELYHNLKAGIKEVCTSEANGRAFYPVPKYGREDMLRILTEKKFDALPEHMRAVAARALEVMLQTRDGQRCDILVDRACLDAMAAAGARSKDPFIRDYENSQVAVTDIKIAVRGERTGKSREFLREALAPVEGLDVRRMAQAASKGRDSLLLFLSEHGYSEAAEAIKESPSAFERWCDNHLMKTIRPQKRNLASVGPVVAYYLARENEIRTARIILTAKANGFSEDATRERVREMYV